MKRIRAAAIAALALLAVAALAPAAAQAATKKTTIELDFAEPIDNGPLKRGGMGGIRDFVVGGHLRSVDKCLRGRSMKLVAIRGNKTRKVDTDRSSGAGAWAFRGRLDPSRDDLKITVERSKAGRDACGADSVRLNGGPQPAFAG